MEFFTIGYTGLFLICFFSATILTFPSEVFLAYMLGKGYDPLTCLVLASIGNSLGGLTNYGIGRLGNPKWLRKLGMDEVKIQKREALIQQYGSWMALFSWVPIIGDPLVICLGFFRVSFFRVLVLLVLGKFLRYLLVIYCFPL